MTEDTSCIWCPVCKAPTNSVESNAGGTLEWHCRICGILTDTYSAEDECESRMNEQEQR